MINVVWFKRDFRLLDHKPLFEASKSGKVLLLFVTEPSIWNQKDLSRRHFNFILQSLIEMKQELRKRSSDIYFYIGEMTEALDLIKQEYKSFTLYAHEENGTSDTFKRDIEVHNWMKKNNLSFFEYPEYGVIRKMTEPQLFEKKWYDFMGQPILPIPSKMEKPNVIPSSFFSDINNLESFEVKGKPIQFGQVGGESKAHSLLNTFLKQRSINYNYHNKKPYYSADSCSRLSPYLAWGNISMRYVAQQTNETILNAYSDKHRQMLVSFFSRLYWHCNFIQQLENQPNMHEVELDTRFANIRNDWDRDKYKSWYVGKTGFPMVDAAMRSLHLTGWVNFHCRAIVVSFACNTLQLDWRKIAYSLSQLFLDYEPGIHFTQMQMQSAVFNQDNVPLYNPVKQGASKDAEGLFIKKFIPELRNMPLEFLHEPHKYDHFEQFDYPAPIIDLEESNRYARDLLWGLKKDKNYTPTKQLNLFE